MSSLVSPLLRLGDAVLHRAADQLTATARVARFLGGRTRFEERDSDVYVVTYPRSGTTWMQFMVYLLVHHGRDDFDHLAAVSPWWERTLAWRPDGPEHLASLPSPRILKSHLPFYWLPGRGRIIYLERDGRDVALSYFHLYRSHLAYRGSFDTFFDRFLRGDLQYRSWFKHVAGWREQRANPRVLWLRYEDLLHSPATGLHEVACFLEHPLPEPLLADILRQSRFAAMKSQEERFDHIGELLINRSVEHHAFLRSGRRGEGAAALAPELTRRFRLRLGRPIRWPALEWRIADFLF